MSCCNKEEREAKTGLPHSTAVSLEEQVQYGDGAIVSRSVVDSHGGSITLFAFDRGQKLSEHTAPFDALVQVLDGRLELTIGGKDVSAPAGKSVLMPADVPHALEAVEKTKMLLVMIKD